jgi:hypothetical protein
MKIKNAKLFDEFKSWMEGKDYKTTVSASYVAYLRTLLIKLYAGGYTVIPNPEELFNNIMGYPSLVKGLLEYFDDAIKKAYSDTNCPITQKQLNNGRSAFRKFVEFLLWRLGQVTANNPVVSQMAIKQTAVYTKPTKVYQNMMGWIFYTQNDIVRVMKSRLGTQDRISGDKVWLLMRLVKKLLGKDWFNDWCEVIIDRTKVFVDDQGTYVWLSQVDKLILKPESDGSFSVWAVVGNQEYRVYTHSRTRVLIPMMAEDMGDVSLEHTHTIDETLKDLGNRHCLPELSKISDVIKQVYDAIRDDKKPTASDLIQHITADGNEVKSDNPIASASIDLEELLKEMDLIRDDTDYELMNRKENISIGNSSGGTSAVPSTPFKGTPVPTTSANVASTKKAFSAIVTKTGMEIDPYQNWLKIEEYEDGERKLIKCAIEAVGEIVIPMGVTEIDSYAFMRCTGIVSVVIPESVTTIGFSAFEKSGLTHITLPDSVTEIGECAFQGCTELKEVIMSNSVTEIEEKTFAGCAKMTSIIIPNSVTRIGEGAFAGCDGLASVVLSNSLAVIEKETFLECVNLINIDVPESVTEICKDAFGYCKSLTSITLPNSLRKIGERVFQRCSSLKSIYIPNSVTEIGEEAFDYCTSLASVVIPDSLEIISTGLFNGCSGLAHVTIPNSVVIIQDNAFDGCWGLTDVVFPKSVKALGVASFNATIKSLFINDSLDVYDISKAFYSAILDSIVVSDENKNLDSRENCNAIINTANNELVLGCKNTKIPESVESIGKSAFAQCDGLTSIDIPESVCFIDKGAFLGCNDLHTITFRGRVEFAEKEFIRDHHCFDGCDGIKRINVPAKELDYYLSVLPEWLHSTVVGYP